MAKLSEGEILQWLLGKEGNIVTDVKLRVVMVSTMVVAMGIFLVSPIVSSLTGPFGVSGAQAGQLVTAYTAPSILLIPAMGVLADRTGRRPVLVGGLTLFGLTGAAIALTTSFEVALILRVFQGAGYSAVSPLTITLLGDFYDGSSEATAQGLRGASVQVVSLLSAPVAGVLVLGSWQYPFFFYALAAVVAVWAWFALPSVDVDQPTAMRKYLRDLVGAIKQPVVVSVLFAFTVRFVLTFSFFAFVSVRLSQLGGSSVESGFLVSIYGLMAIVSTTQSGRLTAWANGSAMLVVGFLVTGAGMVLMGLASSYSWVAGGVVLFGLGGGLTGPTQKFLVTRMSSSALRAGAVSSAFVFQTVGQTVGPLLMALLVQAVPVSTAFVAFGVTGGLIGASLGVVTYWTWRR